MWTPSNTILGTINEEVTFSHQITYEDIDPITTLSVSYPVTVVATTSIPTVNILSNIISGYYTDSFTNSIQYLNKDESTVITDKFNKITDLYEMISYNADTTTTKTFVYTATAKDPVTNSVVATQVYTIIVQNDWTTGKNNLQSYVGTTYASNS